MTHFKKLTSLFIAVIMLLQINAVFAENEADGPTAEETEIVYTDKQNQIMGLMQKLGAADSGVSLEAEVTRAQFASVLMNALGQEGADEAVTFWDLPEMHEYYSGVGAAASRGFVEGYGEKVFLPDKPIDSDEALAILLNAMGFKEIADLSGKYPGNYRTLAHDTGMSKSVTTYKSALTGMQMYELLYEAFDANVCIRSSYKIGSGGYTISDNKTLLSEYRSIYKTHGIMNSSTKTALRGFEWGSRRINVGGTYYIAESGEFDEYLGYDTNLYYYSGDGMETVFYIMPRSRVEEIVINARDIDKLDGEYLKYTEDGRSKKAKIPAVHNLIFNGKYKGDYDSAVFKQPNGTVRLVSAEGNDEYSVIFIETHINTRVKRIDVGEDKIKLIGARGNMKDYEFRRDESYTYEFFTADGTPAAVEDLSSVKANTTVSIEPSEFDESSGVRQIKDKCEYIKFVICTDTAEGRADSVYDEDGRNYVHINGEKYPVSRYGTFDGGKVKIGDEGIFYLDYTGEIVDFDVPSGTKSGLQWGYLIDAKLYYEDEERFRFKILNSDGEVQWIDEAKKFRINDAKKNTVNFKSDLLSSARMIASAANAVSQPIRYELNDEGEIKSIQTVLTDIPGKVIGGDEEHIRRDTVRERLYTKWQAGGNFFADPWGSAAGKNVFARPKITFSVPTALSGDEYYSVVKTFNESDTYNIEAYNLSDGLVPEMAVCYVNSATDSLGLRMITKTEYKLDEDNQAAMYVSCTDGNSNYEYKAENASAASGLKRGDLVTMYGIKSQNILTRYTTVLKIGNLPSTANSNLSINGVNRYDFGEVYFNESRNLVIQNGPISTGLKRNNMYAAFFPSDSSITKVCIVYDNTENSKGDIRKANIDDIKTVYQNGKSASLVYSILRYGELQTVVIYNLAR